MEGIHCSKPKKQKDHVVARRAFALSDEAAERPRRVGDCVATAPRDASGEEQERPRNDICSLVATLASHVICLANHAGEIL